MQQIHAPICSKDRPDEAQIYICKHKFRLKLRLSINILSTLHQDKSIFDKIHPAHKDLQCKSVKLAKHGISNQLKGYLTVKK